MLHLHGVYDLFIFIEGTKQLSFHNINCEVPVLLAGSKMSGDLYLPFERCGKPFIHCVVPPSSNSGKWSFSSEFPAKTGIILWWLLLGTGTTQFIRIKDFSFVKAPLETSRMSVYRNMTPIIAVWQANKQITMMFRVALKEQDVFGHFFWIRDYSPNQ